MAGGEDSEAILKSIRFLLAEEDYFNLEYDLQGVVCSICQYGFEAEQMASIPPCFHVMHRKCFDKFVIQSGQDNPGVIVVICPSCHSEFLNNCTKNYIISRDLIDLSPTADQEPAQIDPQNVAQQFLQNPALLHQIDNIDEPVPAALAPPGLFFEAVIIPANLRCGRCLGNFEVSQYCVYSRGCRHLYHVACYMFLDPENTCCEPNCGALILPDVHHIPSETFGENGLPQ